MKIAIGSDHAGLEQKQTLINHFKEWTWIDCGTKSSESVDYPDFANLVCQSVLNKKTTFGILICGSGQGMCMRANKFKDIRAALCWTKEVATLAREHNDANVLCLGARVMNTSDFDNIVKAFVTTPFAGGRHQARVNKVSAPI